jgi:hypothetical protein
MHRAVEAVLHRLLPVAAALGHDAVEEGLHLLHVEREVAPLDQEVLAAPRRGRDLRVVPVPVRDGPDARRRYEALHGRGQVVHVAFDLVDDVLHASGRIDDDRDVEADLPEAAHVAPERRPEGPARAAAAPAETDAARAGARRCEAGTEVDTGADRTRRTREVDDRRGRSGNGLLRHRDRLGARRLEQLLQGAVRRRVARRHRHGQVLQREYLAPPVLPEAGAAAGADAESRADAEPEPSRRAQHVEKDHQAEHCVRRRRSGEGSEQAPRAGPGRGVERSCRDHRKAGVTSGLWAPRKGVKGRRRARITDVRYQRSRARSSRACARLRATSLPAWSRMTSL